MSKKDEEIKMQAKIVLIIEKLITSKRENYTDTDVILHTIIRLIKEL